eukprot:Gregarina_sp_Pseudo_9__860@NODE_1551_length_1502_cov_23_614491_g1438_i0_p1_GENE_NODE_1551_length_1502_cov_23_614491_g1438_i0NODE_1551_length_1502_cov_23_614491_g1438_i0_p1_ORF_typecomplete_len384_score103_94Thioredoxin/PF00085_20/8_5e03Thioredoxin/PF00085_20/4_9e11Thioredoxin_6/PF13848_6/0_015Thioredoxin_6/PF13848_6/0_54OST3_OST6/PF04756_13/1_6e04OST3_OST6/PF04756_13/3_5e03OST3_OST6/PF04756_13/9e05Thioredoxin_2/PF13098_6/0_00097Thioredoxin_7/PF13899_6/0_0077Thioredoxin_8/PF13905_6/0_045Glutaredo
MLSRKRRDGDDKSSSYGSSQLRGLRLLNGSRAVTMLYVLLVAGLVGVAYFGVEILKGNGGEPAMLEQERGSRLETGGNRGMLRSRSTYLDWQGETSEWFKRSPQGRFVFVFYQGLPSATNPTQTDPDPIKQAVETLSLRNPSKYPFAYSTVTTKEHVDTFSNILSDGFLTEEYPALLLLDVIDGYKKYLMPLGDRFDMTNITKIDVEDFQDFIERSLLQPYADKKLKPYLRSERLELSEEDLDEAHKIPRAINSTFFHERLLPLREEAEFFVIFYAPWCGHCRRFHELFRPLARLVHQKTKGIGFYKIDSTKNDIDHPAISVARVPHVRFFSKWNDFQNPVVFDHRAKEVTEENLKNFLATHSRAGRSIVRTWKVGEVNLDEL